MRISGTEEKRWARRLSAMVVVLIVIPLLLWSIRRVAKPARPETTRERATATPTIAAPPPEDSLTDARVDAATEETLVSVRGTVIERGRKRERGRTSCRREE